MDESWEGGREGGIEMYWIIQFLEEEERHGVRRRIPTWLSIIIIRSNVEMEDGLLKGIGLVLYIHDFPFPFRSVHTATASAVMGRRAHPR